MNNSDITRGNKLRNRYPALTIIVNCIRAVAACIGLISLLTLGQGVVSLFSSDKDFWSILFGLLGMGIVLFLIAYGESIKVVLDIESNTRRALKE